MPRAWRITKVVLAARAFDGEGARLHGGRWNSPGAPLVYAAQCQALAALEMLVHLQASELLTSYCTVPVEFADELVEGVDPLRLSADWRQHPPPSALQQFGDRWAAEQRSVVLKAPSVLVPAEFNYVLNPGHPDFRQVVIGEPKRFQFDPRLG